MTVGAVIVTFQTPPGALAATLASLRQNGCHRLVIIANNQLNRGFAAAANRGAAQLTTDLVLFLNPDAVLTPASLPTASRYLAAHTSCGIAGLLLISPRGRPETRAFGPPVTPLSLLTRHLARAAAPSAPLAVGWVSGGALVIRRSLFVQLGGFDEQFFLYWEDVDLCRRARRLGHKTVLVPGARAIHQRGASLPDAARKTALYDAAADKYFRKYYAPWICRSLAFLRSRYRMFSPRAD